jgi:ABC-2 type transport system ATP-binding protein
MSSILTVKNLTKKFGNLLAVNHLDFEIQKGNVYGLLGPNGSGKSTTLGMILNVVNKTSGNIEWFDGKLTTSQALKKTGALIERPNFYPYMSAYQNLELVCKIKEISTDRIQEKLEWVGLADRQHDKFKTYSLGMKQRLAIASALLNEPELLILDEPTNGLDPKGIHEIRNIISKIAQTGKTIILASHLLDEVEKVCSHVIILQEGNKIFEGKVSEMSLRQSWFEISSADLEKLVDLLQKFPEIDNVVIENRYVKAYFDKGIEGSELNKYLADNGIYVDMLVKKQPTLEEEFLKITN